MTKLINKLTEFTNSILSPNGDLSAKRFWGGVIIANCVVLSWITPENKDLILGMLAYGSLLLGAGIIEKFKDKKSV